MKRQWVQGLFVLFVSVLSAQVSAMSMGEALNQAGRQRMLSQRIVAFYAASAQDLQPDSERQLHEAIAQFEQQLQQLRGFEGAGQPAQNALSNLAYDWASLKAQLKRPPTPEAALELQRASESVLQASQRVVLELQQQASSTSGRLINVSGRQRMLSQRISKNYLLLAWGVRDPQLQNDLEQARREFVQALQELEQARENTPELQRKLAQVRIEWGVFEKAFQINQGQGEFIPLLVLRSAESILQRMEEITSLYEERFLDGRA